MVIMICSYGANWLGTCGLPTTLCCLHVAFPAYRNTPWESISFA